MPPGRPRSNSTIGRKNVEKPAVQRQRTIVTDTGSPKQSSQPQTTASPSPSPYSNIRSPEHWLPYPDVIQGAIAAVTAKMNNVELRGRVASCLSDVLTNQRSLLAAYQLHFEKKDKNTTTTRNYHKIARQILVEHLGEEKLDQRLLPYLSRSTTFEQLKVIVESLKNAKSTPAKVDFNANIIETPPPKTTRRATALHRTTSAIPAQKRRFGLEESDDEEEDRPPFKKPELQAKRSYSRTSLRNSTPVLRKKEKEKDLSQEEEEIPPQEQSLLSSNENFDHGVLVPFVNRTTRNRGNGMELCTFGPYEQRQHAFLHERQNRLSIQRRQVLLTAPNRKPTKFRGTVEELREEIRKVLDGHYHGDINDMVEVLLKYVLMAHRMSIALQRSKVPFDLLMASMSFLGHWIALDELDLVDDE